MSAASDHDGVTRQLMVSDSESAPGAALDAAGPKPNPRPGFSSAVTTAVAAVGDVVSVSPYAAFVRSITSSTFAFTHASYERYPRTERRGTSRY